MTRPSILLPMLLGFGLLLAGCSESEEDEAAPVTPRPVRSIVLSPTDPQALGYSGTIQPRFETSLAFRTMGRMISRSVDVGSQVEAGQTLAAIDAETLNADLRSARAQLVNAELQARTAIASAERTAELFRERTVAQSELDDARESRSAAEADLVSAKAQVAKAEDALSYAVLTAPFDGVITERDADVGQVVSTGTTVMKLARTDLREAVVDIPGAEVGGISVGSPFEVVLQVAPTLTAEGKVREIAPQADALTRTFRVRILLDNPPEAFRLGALVAAIPAERADQPILLLPPSAILEEDGKSFVWIVDREAETVHLKEVQTERDAGGRIILLSGAEPGAILVTAGVHSLKEGQKVSLSKGFQS
ncbi:efflux RND transporter periplasmic adaptor subunit [Aurantimonas sp. 22II-16-19i]|uniref:efflux RND transporter periplasmic adaptor subunit n=1 Tax=Aurantimonas sp. 22II-16-19i TaxID=1317114 RepID=UPI0009F80297|nr:efflux RND transporter periplasmic adaptor subunit [Aurantimonas sp. 22II-16-19i]ORE97312.1 RND family efflux transporter MFP subunit [Aurantimonas sp. 22II-16-19i]